MKLKIRNHPNSSSFGRTFSDWKYRRPSLKNIGEAFSGVSYVFKSEFQSLLIFSLETLVHENPFKWLNDFKLFKTNLKSFKNNLK